MKKGILNDFIKSEIYDFQEEANLCLEYCEEENEYHLVSYWINGTQEIVLNFLKRNYNLSIIKEILRKYPNNLKELKNKIIKKYKRYDAKIISFEALNTILLKEFQKLPQWYSIYGCEENDFLDFEKYNINNALFIEDDFPIIKISDISAAMLGVNDTVTPSDLYDVFAHYADYLTAKNLVEENDDKIFNDNKEQIYTNIFTPDIFQTAAVISRYKNYIDYEKKDISDYSLDYFDLMKLPQIIRNEAILNYVIEDYYNRFNNPPKSLPLQEKSLEGNIVISKEENKEKFQINYYIQGIQNYKTEINHIYSKIYDIPEDSQELKSLIISIAIDFKRELCGLEKVRNKDIASIEGKYPNKYSATHGLTFIKDANVECKDKKRNREYKKEPKTKFNLALAEKQSLYIIKKILRKAPSNPIISCSFGIDSITVLHLIKRVTNNFKILFNNSLIEYPDLIKYKNTIIKEWKLEGKVLETKPKETYWQLLDKNGWNFKRKGYRGKDKIKTGKKESSEICCMKIKHKPTYELIDQLIRNNNPISVNFTGIRACESKAREQAGKRDNVIYFSKTWRCIKSNPILFFTNKMVWDYVKKYNIKYCAVYDKKLYYEDIYTDLSDDEYGKVYYEPRCGCWSWCELFSHNLSRNA